MQVEARQVAIDDARIYYQVAGTGPPLVLVHGLSASGRWWAKNLPALADHFRTYVIDLVGFGRSRARRRFVLGEAAASLARWLDAIGVERADIVGHSMGGFIAADLAADFPRRVSRLVLVDAAALPIEYGRLRHAIGLARSLRYTPIRFLPLLATDAARAGPVTLWKAANELIASDISEKIARIAAPTLVVWGEHDALVPLGIGQRLAQTIPSARLAVIPGAGHNPMWDRPEAFNQEVLDFLLAERRALA